MNSPDNLTTTPTHIIIVEHQSDWREEFLQHTVVLAKDYLAKSDFLATKGIKVINLCRSYSYLSTGYYCSLLAEARRHRVVPGVKTISELSRKSLYSLDAVDLDALVQKQLRESPQKQFEIQLFFGQCSDARLEVISRQIFDMFPSPLLRIEFKKNGKWSIDRIRPMYINQLSDAQHQMFHAGLEKYLTRRWRRRVRNIPRYDLAILYNHHDQLPPSDRGALRRFITNGKQLGVNVEILEKKDYGKLAEYDALFIRETTSMENYTYRFARKAESENMVVIDDPDSILKCTNKIYLAELLRSAKVPRPKTVILQKGNLAGLEDEIAYPIVLKIPDGSFSRGVYKATDRKELIKITALLFKESDLILAQEFIYTEFDWRIGVLNHQPVYACQYFMSRNHWQIVKHRSGGRFSEGGSHTLAVEKVPAKVVDTALKAAGLIGDGLYGVDVKQTDKGVFCIEVNDNPNIDHGVEDAVLNDELYRTILREFIARLDKKRQA